jgi:hypothetical protein
MRLEAARRLCDSGTVAFSSFVLKSCSVDFSKNAASSFGVRSLPAYQKLSVQRCGLARIPINDSPGTGRFPGARKSSIYMVHYDRTDGGRGRSFQPGRQPRSIGWQRVERVLRNQFPGTSLRKG